MASSATEEKYATDTPSEIYISTFWSVPRQQVIELPIFIDLPRDSCYRSGGIAMIMTHDYQVSRASRALSALVGENPGTNIH